MVLHSIKMCEALLNMSASVLLFAFSTFTELVLPYLSLLLSLLMLLCWLLVLFVQTLLFVIALCSPLVLEIIVSWKRRFTCGEASNSNFFIEWHYPARSTVSIPFAIIALLVHNSTFQAANGAFRQLRGWRLRGFMSNYNSNLPLIQYPRRELSKTKRGGTIATLAAQQLRYFYVRYGKPYNITKWVVCWLKCALTSTCPPNFLIASISSGFIYFSVLLIWNMYGTSDFSFSFSFSFLFSSFYVSLSWQPLLLLTE